MNLRLCMKMNVINTVMLLLILQYMLIFVVRGEEDLTCEAGYTSSGKRFTSGKASQCSGLSKITTAAECRSAAEYNSKNNIDKNVGYWGRLSVQYSPPGCIYDSGENKYYWNDNTKSTKQCSNSWKCICKPNMSPTDIRTSGDASQCSGISKITTEAECKLEAEYISKNNIDKNRGYGGRVSTSGLPPGCFYNSGTFIYGWNYNTKSTKKCSPTFKCICKYTKTCIKCPFNTYSKGGINSTCTPCPKENATTNFLSGQTSVNACKPVQPKPCPIGNEVTGDGITTPKTCKECAINHYNDKHSEADVKCKPCKNHLKTKGTGQSRCIREFSKEYVMWKLDNIDKIMAEQKEKQNDLSIKNSRLWQKEQIRLQHDKLMKQRKEQDDKKEKLSCEKQRNKGTIIFPAIEIANEIEKIEDTTCIDTNRDELLKSFCSFTSDLDKLFNIQNISKEAKSFWPNMCCKERRDTTLEACEDSSGRTKREDIIPFALSQGGNYSRHNLYAEVTDTIKKNGYLHEGMMNLLDSLSSMSKSKKKNANRLINTFFDEVSLCGPRIVDAPGGKERTKLCELFIPYKHAMTNFYNLIESLYTQPLQIQSSFLETMEGLRKRSKAARIGKHNMQQVMQMKPKTTAQATCTGGSKWTSSNLNKTKKVFCKGYNHLDLSMPSNIRNVAVYYLKNDINTTTYKDNKEMLRLSKQLRYQVTDISCPAPLFTADDISIQQVAMDVLGEKKEWVAVVNLNTQDENGYLQSELPYCEDRKFLIGAKVVVKAYVDDRNCCKMMKDSTKCEDLCGKPLRKLNDTGYKHYSKDILLTGTYYKVTNSHLSDRRRRLLRSTQQGC